MQGFQDLTTLLCECCSICYSSGASHLPAEQSGVMCIHCPHISSPLVFELHTTPDSTLVNTNVPEPQAPGVYVEESLCG